MIDWARREASASWTFPPVLVSSRRASSRVNPMLVIWDMASSGNIEGAWLGGGWDRGGCGLVGGADCEEVAGF